METQFYNTENRFETKSSEVEKFREENENLMKELIDLRRLVGEARILEKRSSHS